mmetsp:Transcript_19279/g.63690  ORF Transcript_19279/g.63690 Transcript_19279/m.63690 type:complete len:375 (-) Transcript_19279:11-1135(-)
MSLRLDETGGGPSASRRSISLIVRRRPRAGYVKTTTISVDLRHLLPTVLIGGLLLLPPASGMTLPLSAEELSALARAVDAANAAGLLDTPSAEGTCFSHDLLAWSVEVFQMGLSFSSRVRVQQGGSGGDAAELGDDDDWDDLVLTVGVEGASKAATATALSAALVLATLLLTLGEYLVSGVVLAAGSGASFVGLLWVWNAVLKGQELDWTRCTMPSLLAAGCALLSTLLLLLLLRKFVTFSIFAVGAAAGVVGALSLRSFLYAENPALVDDSDFSTFFVGLAAASGLACGVIAVCLERPVLLLASCCIGGYAFAVAVSGLVSLRHNEPLAAWAFLLVALLAATTGLIVQVCVTRVRCGKKREPKGHTRMMKSKA